MADFKVGDVVELKTGSREMTINYVVGEDPDCDQERATWDECHGDVQCKWYDEKKEEFDNEVFFSDMLKLKPLATP